MWSGRYLAVRRQGRWEYAERTRDIAAAVIVAVDDLGCVLLVEQYRVPIARACLELPAGLVGDEEACESVLVAARRELEEETGYRATRLEERGEYFSSPGMTSEHFTLVVASGLDKIADGGGVAGEDITVHRVAIGEIAAFVAAKRRAGVAIDAKLLMLLGSDILGGL
ncbi:MAG: NUDIX hydrolase [Pseudomonadota bacterium]|nr:NUDIX hydrolase [Pseudomonadota bacterium]